MQLSARMVAELVVALSKDSITSVADRYARRMRTAFLVSIHNAQDTTPVRRLEDVLALGTGTGAASFLLRDVFAAMEEEMGLRTAAVSNLARLVATAFNTAGDTAADALGVAFDRTNPEAVNWARAHAATLITDISKKGRDAIRVIVTRGFEEGIAPRQLAKLVRSNIGLTERDATAVMNYRKRLMGDAVRNDIAHKKVEKYAEKLLRKRSLDIAITESHTAANQGQRELWWQAVERGQLKRLSMKMLIVADPCPICAPMVGEKVAWDAEFSRGLPPFHVRCKCVEGLV